MPLCHYVTIVDQALPSILHLGLVAYVLTLLSATFQEIAVFINVHTYF